MYEIKPKDIITVEHKLLFNIWESLSNNKESKNIDSMSRNELLEIAKEYKEKMPQKYITLKTEALREIIRKVM